MDLELQTLGTSGRPPACQERYGRVAIPRECLGPGKLPCHSCVRRISLSVRCNSKLGRVRGLPFIEDAIEYENLQEVANVKLPTTALPETIWSGSNRTSFMLRSLHYKATRAAYFTSRIILSYFLIPARAALSIERSRILQGCNESEDDAPWRS